WNRRCPFCNALLLSSESNTFCCGNGQRRLPPLHALPSRMQSLLSNEHYACHLIDHGRVLNNLFTFAGIGVTGGFQQLPAGGFNGPPSVAITGRTYH
ncbi:hypothetical protein BKA83DRAFT_4009133, partial [Pisolithus microcarpus]